jgi:hypothetical protein
MRSEDVGGVRDERGIGGSEWSSAAELVARRLPRRNFLVRAGGWVTTLAVASSGVRLIFPEIASASCMEGDHCVKTTCHRRYVCGCQDVLLRHCPGGSDFARLGCCATFDIQIAPEASEGYYYGFAYGGVNERGWVNASCLTTYSCCSGCGSRAMSRAAEPAPPQRTISPDGPRALTPEEWDELVGAGATGAAATDIGDGPGPVISEPPAPPGGEVEVAPPVDALGFVDDHTFNDGVKGRWHAHTYVHVRYCPDSQAFGWMRPNDHIDVDRESSGYLHGVVYGCLNREGWVNRDALTKD